MNTVRIYAKNAQYQKFVVLKTNRNKRYHYGEFFVEGVRNINEAVRGGWKIVSFLYTADRPLSNWALDLLRTVKTDVNYALPDALLSELSGKTDSSELLAIVKMREESFSQLHLPGTPLLALFDRPSNKGNLGTIIRSCDALGVDGLILTGHGVDLYDPEVIVASMGSFFRVPVIRIAGGSEVDGLLSSLRQRYPFFQTIGTTARREERLYELDLKKPTLFMIGNETEGLSKTLKEKCEILATIPMSEKAAASSLNVSCAATALFYEAVRQRSSL